MKKYWNPIKFYYFERMQLFEYRDYLTTDSTVK